MHKFLMAIVCVGLAGCVTVPVTPTETVVMRAPSTAFGQALVDLRADNGVGPIMEDATLRSVATAHAAQMQAQGSLIT